jgi:DNA-directed RNA polymerase specialized sigma subunit
VELRGQFSKSAEIKRDLKEGELTQSAIAKKYGVSRQYVFQVKKKMGG